MNSVIVETLVVIVKQTHLQKCLLVCHVLVNLNWVNVALTGSVENPLVIYDDASDDDPYRDAKDVAFAQAYLEKARNTCTPNVHFYVVTG